MLIALRPVGAESCPNVAATEEARVKIKENTGIFVSTGTRHDNEESFPRSREVENHMSIVDFAVR